MNRSGKSRALRKGSHSHSFLGYSQRALGQYQRANEFHQQALEIARNAGDLPVKLPISTTLAVCHLKENMQRQLTTANAHLCSSHRAGDRLGEANALVNLGYSVSSSATGTDSTRDL